MITDINPHSHTLEYGSKILNAKTMTLVLVLLELLSFLGYFFPLLGKIFFVLVSVSIIFATFKKIEYGFTIAIVDLIVNSFGRLFSWGGLSIRMIIWVAIMAAWILNGLKDKQTDLKTEFQKIFSKDKIGIFLLLGLLASVGWGIMNGFVSHNSLHNIINDANAWLYLLLAFPAYSTFSNSNKDHQDNLLKNFFQIFTFSSVFISLESLLLLYIFSHNLYFMEDVYHWVRDTRVGEITQIQGGFYRIFIQSQIYIMAAFFAYLFATIAGFVKKEPWVASLALLSLFFSINILNFSRSNWIGLIGGSLLMLVLAVKKFSTSGLKYFCFTYLASFIIGFALILIIIKFPFPDATGGFSAGDLFMERATELNGEAAVNSRWALLKPLAQKIIVSPFFGKGFGTYVTYYSSDPRVLANNPGGKFTTMSFEWGWLEHWLKIGLAGVVFYVILLIYVIYSGTGIALTSHTLRSEYALGLFTGMFSLALIDFFSPYLNHPLGIGLVIISLILALNLRNSSSGN